LPDDVITNLEDSGVKYIPYVYLLDSCMSGDTDRVYRRDGSALEEEA
jgi:hypothetical protein